MKQSFRIFKRDISRLFHNRAASIVMAGVCILPSLYAWFNIAANMDPYGSTEAIKVAVASNDSTARNEDITLNAGDSIIENLKENNQLGWSFVGESEAIDGVRSGKYFAAIVIPEDFSSSLISILSGHPKEPKLGYYINEKKNAIAPKITETGAGTIQQEINDTFSSVAAETISELIRSSAAGLSADLNRADTKLMDTLKDARANLEDYSTLLEDFQNTIAGSSESIQNAQGILDSIVAAASSGTSVLTDASSALSAARDSTGAFSSQLSQNLSNGETLLNNVYISASTKLGAFETSAEQANSVISSSIQSVEELNAKNSELLEALESLNENIGGNTELSSLISQQIAGLRAQNNSFGELLNSLHSGNSSIGDALETAQSAKTSLEALASQNKEALQNHRSNFDQKLLPGISQSLDSFAALSGSLSSVLSNIQPAADQLKAILGQLGTNLSGSAEILGQTKDALSAVDGQLAKITQDIQALQSSGIYQQILSLENIDSESVSDFMSSPVSIQSEVLYDVKNYGSAMTPFYTNLALWVGGLILVSILKQEVDKDSSVRHFTPAQAYFGRWFLFTAAGLIQGLIVCLGDLLLLKVQCIHPFLFICAGMFCSFVYVNLIYALAITFKHIGKALGVLLVILQIPGSSGTYPIEMTPLFFQKLHPFLPFTYGINAMRESIAGMYQNYYIKNLFVLSLFIPAALLIGLGLRPLLMNLNHLFDKRLSETGIMLGETESMHRGRLKFWLPIRTLLKDDEWRQDFLKRSGQFERRYPKLIRCGFTCMIVIPIIFLVLMFSLESKLIFLILWIISLIALSAYLICIEYIHYKIQQQLAIAGLTSKDLDHGHCPESK